MKIVSITPINISLIRLPQVGKKNSNEYYNLAMDRFYDAQDGNVWLSFPSSERNKVDEETFLILKKYTIANIS